MASRRLELVAINLEDLEVNDLGMDVRVRETKSKSDLIKAVVFSHNEYCPVKVAGD
ncbi:hypothetical protein [Peribacillus kribbensis]|uniref:hypothetical protein n=1 Tax=Peribacillus kribbensis TaxID=356658 RepID=UPI00040F8A99|nr:hypothetical protein [Peribacillus kribbensis]